MARNTPLLELPCWSGISPFWFSIISNSHLTQQREGWTLDRGKDTGLTNKIPTSLIDYLLPRLSRKRDLLWLQLLRPTQHRLQLPYGILVIPFLSWKKATIAFYGCALMIELKVQSPKLAIWKSRRSFSDPVSAPGSAQSRKLISNKSYRGEEGQGWL